MPSQSTDPSNKVAVIGMACLFPGAPDLATFWSNVRRGVDAITEVPAGRWDPVFYDPDSTQVDRLYCRRGGFVDAYARFDALKFGIMPVAAAGCEPDQLLTLQAAHDALEDAGYGDREYARERTGVVIGRGNYSGAGMTRLQQQVRTAEQLVKCLGSLLPGVTEKQLATVRREFQSKLGSYGPDTAIGLVPNLTASRIANRLDLQGPAYTVDAACASSLVAIDQACRDLETGRSDLVLAGGVHLSHDVAFWSVFCQLGALSRSQQIRPFDRRADGLLIGEGLGMVVLKRLADAQRADDRIYAVIHGTGISSDGQETSLMVPRVGGQVLALQNAWKKAGVDPSGIGLIEAHGTGTPGGDSAELQTLARVFGPSPGEKNGGSPVIGSVKSMIGHTMPAAGMAGFIKAALSIHHAVRPPTLHCEEPHPLLEETRFRVVRELESWEGQTRLAGVNAFGFGGINGHVVLGNHAGAAPTHRFQAGSNGASSTQPETILALAAHSPRELLDALDKRDFSAGSGDCRLAVINPTADRLARARTMVERGKPHRDRRSIWFTPDGLFQNGGGKLAFLFPGVEYKSNPRVEDVARAFGCEPPPAAAGPEDVEALGLVAVSVGRLLHKALLEMGIKPDVMAGHSIGEWTGMIASGMISEEETAAFVETLVPGSLEVPGVVFLAAGCGAEKANSLLDGLPDISLSHDNCPHQVILCGVERSIDEAHARLRKAKVLCQKLPFRSGFHSPLFSDYIEPHRKHFESLSLQRPHTPLWSATLATGYPSGPDPVRALAVEHLIQPIRFREMVEGLHADGVRAFVQMGDGSLSASVNDTLKGLPHLAISAASSRREGLVQLRHVACALFVEGWDADPTRVPGTVTPAADRSIPLQLGVPLVHLSTTLNGEGDFGNGSALPEIPNPTRDPVIAEHNAVLLDIASSQRAILEAWRRSPRQNPTAVAGRPQRSRLRKLLSVDTFPELMDHCFFRQAEEWPVLSDWYPVVPMTMCIALMMEAATDLVPGRVAVEVSHLRAYRWLAVSPPLKVDIRSAFDGDQRVQVSIQDEEGKGYVEGVVQMAPAYPLPPAFEPPRLVNERPVSIDAGQLYRDRWMFHGPRYQGVTRLEAMGDDGIRGSLVACPGKGGLLDNAGQLLGYWVMAQTQVDRLAMPITLDRLNLFGPEPARGTAVDCAVNVRRLGQKRVRADMKLWREGKLWAVVEGWTDQRFQTDERLWPVIQFADRNILAEIRPEGYALVGRLFENAPSRDYFVRRYLTASEREAYEALGERKRHDWLYGRIAAKDAVRHWLWENGHGALLFPAQVQIENEPSGAPLVRGNSLPDLQISIAHKDGLAVARVALSGPVGIDLERIEPRSPQFTQSVLSASEVALLPQADRDEWVTRCWCAKEAAGKALGTGLRGAPKKLVVTRIEGECLEVAGQWVGTKREDGWGADAYVVAWTLEEQVDRQASGCVPVGPVV
ncbi:MAG: type I polyketide synthase [Acidobacteriota bacterium]